MFEEIRIKLNELTDLFKKLEEQNAIKEKCKRWRGKRDEEYWFISESGEPCHTMETSNELDRASYKIGNYFRTEKEAEKTLEKIKIYMQLKDLALRLNKGEKIDWDNIAQAKWYIYYNHNKALTTINAHIYQNLGQIYCLDKNFLEIAKQEIGEENLKKLFE